MLDFKPHWPDWHSWWLQLRQIQPDLVFVNHQPSKKWKQIEILPTNIKHHPKSTINHNSRLFIIWHLRMLQPKRLFSRESNLLCLTLLLPDVLCYGSTIQTNQVFEGLVHKSPTFATVRLLTGIGIGWAFQPIAMATQPIFVKALKKSPILAWSIYRHPLWPMNSWTKN